MGRVKGGANPMPIARERRGRRVSVPFFYLDGEGNQHSSDIGKKTWADALSRISARPGWRFVVVLPHEEDPDEAERKRKVMRASINKSALRRFTQVSILWDRTTDTLVVSIAHKAGHT